MSRLMEAIRNAQFLANARNKPQAVIMYQENNEIKYCVTETIIGGTTGVLWYRPSNDPMIRLIAKEKYDEEMAIMGLYLNR